MKRRKFYLNGRNVLKDIKFSFYCITHPIDGFWDISRENKGSYLIANTILALVILIRSLKLKYTGFLVTDIDKDNSNVVLYIGGILLFLALWCIGNWGLTTLFDGKGTLGQIYMGTCYSLLPYLLIQIPLMIYSNLIVINEIDFYYLVNSISIIWVAVLIILAMGQIHDFGLGKNVIFVLGTLFSVLVMLFIILIFFSTVSQGINYIIEAVKEFTNLVLK